MSVLAAALAVAAVTAGWENVCPDRREFPVTKVLWQADFTRRDDFKVELRGGAEGRVDFAADGIRVVKSNAAGSIIVTAKPFAVAKGRQVRFVADQTSDASDVNYSNGFLRYYGRKERLTLNRAEGNNFWGGGTQTMRGLPCTAPGMKYRKFAQCYAEDDVVTPVLVVSGNPSDSRWTGWLAEDVDAAQAAWQPHWDAMISADHSGERIDEAEFDRMIAGDVQHDAKIARIGGVSRLMVDGQVVAPVVYKSKHVYDGSSRNGGDTFAGRPFDGGDIRLMVKEISLGRVPGARGYWTREGFDAKGAVRELKDAMRIAPKSLFMVALGCKAYPEFTTQEHPEEAWLRKDGKPVLGNGGSCIVGYSSLGKGVKQHGPWPWVSPSSRVWRDAVRRCIRAFVAELKAQGLDKRVVGAHIWGYHDGQFSVPYVDYSAAARAEYARYVAEPGCLSTNYAFACKQFAFRAEEEFAREFKRSLGKDAVVAMWCESPFGGDINDSQDVTSFVRSDAIDVMVCQPSYRERLPGYPTLSSVPVDSLHLHGKMFWHEFDLRTYAALESWANSWPSMKSLGHSADFPMWQSVYRKLAGEMDAARMGYWFYDMGGGWFAEPKIAADIGRVVREERELALDSPSAWRPDVAVVADEVYARQDGEEFAKSPANGMIYSGQFRYFGTSGVPYERYLAEDVLERPELLDGMRMVVLAFFRRIDARRAAFLDLLAKRGVTLVFLSETGLAEGAECVRFAPFVRAGKCRHEVVPEPGVTDNVASALYTDGMRNGGRDEETLYRCSVKELPGVRVLARYAADGLPAVAERRDADCRRVYVCEPGGLTPDLFARFARESGAYAAVDRPGCLQVNMNGDFVSVHCLRPGRYDFRLPFACRVVNLKSGCEERVADGRFALELTAGQSCRFRLDASVRVSSFGFDADDSTEILQRALDSGARRIVLDRQAGPWVTRPLQVRSNTELVFEEGAELLARRGEYKGAYDALVSLDCVTNVVLRGLGKGGTLRMWKTDYQKPPYKPAEWRHTLNILSSEDVRVENLTLVSSGGDGIYLGESKKNRTNRRVVIRDCVCDDHHRQGISVITANGLLIERTAMRNTKGTAPESGIDFEPNGWGQELQDVVMRDCVSENNAGAGYDMYLGQLGTKTRPVSITLERCKAIGNRRSPLPLNLDASNRNTGVPPGGRFVVRGCEFRDSPQAAVMFTDKPFGVMDTVFEDCVISNCPSGATTSSSVRLATSRFALPPTDAVTFRNVTIYRSRGGDWFSGSDRPWLPCKVKAIRGEVTVVEDGVRRRIVLDEAWRKAHFPELPAKPNLARVPFRPTEEAEVVDRAPGRRVELSAVRFRGDFAAWFWAAKPGPVTFEAQIARVNAKPTAGKPFVVVDASGRTVAELAAPTRERQTFSFAAPAAGFYRVTSGIAPHALVFLSSDAPVGLVPNEENGLNVFKSSGSIWFAHRAGEDGALFCCGGSQEFVTERLFDPTGREVAAWVDTDDWQCGVTGPSAPAGLWKIAISAPSAGYVLEDSYLNRTGEPPVFFLSDEKCWK